MSAQADNIKNTLLHFDLNTDEADLYTYILKKDRISALVASRDLKIARTKIYRLLEKLISKGLVVEEIKSYGTKFRAEPPEKLLEEVTRKERELELLKKSATGLVDYLNSLKPLISQDTKILNYRGAEGLKQVTWNSLKAKEILRIYEIELMTSFLDFDFAEKVRREFGKRKTIVHQLTNQKGFEEYTEQSEHVKYWEPKYIDRSKLDIQFETLIYNDVICFYEYKDQDVFIVEIYNQKLADMQNQIFDLVWEIAKPMKKVGNKGKFLYQD